LQVNAAESWDTITMSEDLPMAPIKTQTWHAGLLVGNALLDKQHIVLVKLIRSLKNTQGALNDDAFMQALHDIVRLLERHCAAEEHLLALNAYEWLEQHREEHLAGLDRIRSIYDRCARGDISRESACAAVANWFETHLVEIDLPAQGYLRSATGPSTAHEASEPLEIDSALESA
jgi:hemerythrin-like metal-binding protein